MVSKYFSRMFSTFVCKKKKVCLGTRRYFLDFDVDFWKVCQRKKGTNRQRISSKPTKKKPVRVGFLNGNGLLDPTLRFDRHFSNFRRKITNRKKKSNHSGTGNRTDVPYRHERDVNQVLIVEFMKFKLYKFVSATLKLPSSAPELQAHRHRFPPLTVCTPACRQSKPFPAGSLSSKELAHLVSYGSRA